MKRSLLLAFLAPILTVTPCKAPIFMKYDGVDGESSSTNHPNAIEIESFSWGATNTAAGAHGAGGGGGAGKVQFHDLHFTAKISKATPQLLLACISTNPVPSATLFVSKSETDP